MTQKPIDDYLKKLNAKGNGDTSNKPSLSSKPVLEDTTSGLIIKSKGEFFQELPPFQQKRKKKDVE